MNAADLSPSPVKTRCPQRPARSIRVRAARCRLPSWRHSGNPRSRLSWPLGSSRRSARIGRRPRSATCRPRDTAPSAVTPSASPGTLPPLPIAKSSWPPAMTILYHFRTRRHGAEAVHISGVVRAFEKNGAPRHPFQPPGLIRARPPAPRPSRKHAPEYPAASPASSSSCSNSSKTFPAFLRNLRLARRGECSLIYERHAFFLFSTALVCRPARVSAGRRGQRTRRRSRVPRPALLLSLARWTDRFLFRRARLIVTVSPHLKRRAEAYGVPTDRILVLPNAVSEEDLAMPPSRRAAGPIGRFPGPPFPARLHRLARGVAPP